jgi:hypothetical protein
MRMILVTAYDTATSGNATNLIHIFRHDTVLSAFHVNGLLYQYNFQSSSLLKDDDTTIPEQGGTPHVVVQTEFHTKENGNVHKNGDTA